MPDIATWVSKLPQLVASPIDILSLSYQQLQETYGGTADITDPTNPSILVYENTAVVGAGLINSYEAYNRRLYGNLAQTMDDLYVHMSDKDYLDRFAIPSTAKFQLLFDQEELIAAMVDTGVNSIRQLILPQFFALSVGGYTFTSQYAIKIQQTASGALQIVYDVENVSPLLTLDTNLVPWQVEPVWNGTTSQNFVILTVSLQQMAVTTKYLPINLAQRPVATYAYNDQFYYARAYIVNTDDSLTEIKTTHTDQNFDPNAPTLLLKDLGGSLRVEVPLIYITNGSISTELRVDIYTSKGDISVNLGSYPPNGYSVNWNGASPEDSKYVQPLANFKTMSLGSTDTTNSGRNALSFTALRQRTITNNFGPINTPITPSQLPDALTDLGFQPVIFVDNVTDRIIQATRALPAPASGQTVSGPGMTVETFVSSLEALEGNSNVANNGDRMTLLPSLLFQLVNGQLQAVSDSQLNTLKALDLDALVRQINAGNYLYSPFHYVMDATGNTFALRAYFLDNPIINNTQFIAANPTVGMDVGTGSRTLVRTQTGYKVQIVANSTQGWKDLPDSQVFCQMGFIPEGETQYAYLNGTLVGTNSDGERVFEFDLVTNYDLDSDDNLFFTTFQMFEDPDRPRAAPLTCPFEIFWAATGITGEGVKTSTIDTVLGTQLLPQGVLGIAEERMSMTLGSALNNLWHRSRTVAGSGVYQTYAQDVPMTYASDVYERDANGNIVYTVTGDQVSMNITHHAGDPVLDTNNQPVLLHKAGDPVLDPSTGKPVLVSNGTLVQQMDLLLVEGVYYFVTHDQSVQDKQQIPILLTDYITEDLATLDGRLLENTELYFYPRSTIGDVDVLIQNGQTIAINAAQVLNINFYLDDAAWRDQNLREPLTESAIETITEAFQQKTVSITLLQSALKDAIGDDDVVGIDVNGLGGSLNLTTLTVQDDSMSLSIRKQAVANADGTIAVDDGVSTAFIRHDTTTSLTGISS